MLHGNKTVIYGKNQNPINTRCSFNTEFVPLSQSIHTKISRFKGINRILKSILFVIFVKCKDLFPHWTFHFLSLADFSHNFSCVSTFPPSLAVLSIFICSTDQHRNLRLLCILSTGRHLLSSLEIPDLGSLPHCHKIFQHVTPSDLPSTDTNLYT